MKVKRLKNGNYSVTELSPVEHDNLVHALLLAATTLNQTPAPMYKGEVDPIAVRRMDDKVEEYNYIRNMLMYPG